MLVQLLVEDVTHVSFVEVHGTQGGVVPRWVRAGRVLDPTAVAGVVDESGVARLALFVYSTNNGVSWE